MLRLKAVIVLAGSFALLSGCSSMNPAPATASTTVLLCTGIEYCASCGNDARKTDFSWSYTIDFDASTVDGKKADISDARITWQLIGNNVQDDREINRYTKKFHFFAKDTRTGAELYHGDAICEAQLKKAF